MKRVAICYAKNIGTYLKQRVECTVNYCAVSQSTGVYNPLNCMVDA